jgi:TatD DNase family protein
MIDTHCHLEMCEASDVEGHGLTRVATVGIDDAAIGRALELADAHEEVFAIVGRHPNSAGDFDDDALEGVERAARHPKVVAIGETGLDYYRDYAPREDQERAFAAQMVLARALNKPLVIHTRAAEDRTLAMLAADADGVTVVMHCFSMPDRLDECLERGYLCSFAGNVTYPKATGLQEAAARVPDALLLVETDSPFLSPQPVRGKPNAPANVVHTARKLAELRGVSYEELEQLVERNAARTFGW